MRALITRPEEDAAPLAEALAAKQVEVTVEPLLAIRVLDEPAVDLDGVQALLFTSANGVRAFAARSERRDIGVLTVGEASAEAARAAGFTHVESAGGDVGDLVRLVKARLDPAGGPVFHAAGSVVAGDLAGQLSEAGYSLRRVMLYEARPAESLSPETLTILAGHGFDLVLFFSPRTATTFVELLGKADDPRAALAGCAAADALCLSPAVAAAAQAIEWKSVRYAENPDLPSMLRLVDEAIETVPDPASAAVPAPEVPSVRAAEPLAAAMPPIPELVSTAPRPNRGGAMIAAAIVAAIVTLAGLATEPIWRPYLAGLLPGAPAAGPDPALAQRLDALDAEAASLSQRLAALDGALRQLDARGAGAGADMADLGQRIESLSGEVATLRGDLDAAASAPAAAATAPALPEEISRLPQDIAALRERVDQLAATATAPSGPSPEMAASVDALRADIDAMKQAAAESSGGIDARLTLAEQDLDKLAALDTRLTTLEQATSSAEARATGNAALALAVNQLQAALADQRPFAIELAALKDVTGDDPDMTREVLAATDALAPRAESGLPTLVELRARFPEVARAAVAAARAEAAAAAVADAAPGATGGDPADATPGWLDSAMLKLSELVSVRPVGEDVAGDDAAARVARAEALLGKSDLVGAVAELDGLTGKALAAASGWLADARARLDAQVAIDRLQTLAVARLMPAGDGG